MNLISIPVLSSIPHGQVLNRWPEYFKTQATGPAGATVCRTAQLRAGGGQAQRAAEAREAKVTLGARGRYGWGMGDDGRGYFMVILWDL